MISGKIMHIDIARREPEGTARDNIHIVGTRGDGQVIEHLATSVSQALGILESLLLMPHRHVLRLPHNSRGYTGS